MLYVQRAKINFYFFIFHKTSNNYLFTQFTCKEVSKTIKIEIKYSKKSKKKSWLYQDTRSFFPVNLYNSHLRR